MSAQTEWTITLKRVETVLAVGIHAHEQVPQRLWVDVELRGSYSARPISIAECIDYDFVYRHITQEWPVRPHTPLLEQLATDLLDAVFAHDGKVSYAKVTVLKPDAFANAEVVGVATERRR